MMIPLIFEHKSRIIIFALIGFSLLGDAMLYVVLPTRVDILALTAGQVGVLLSINRIIRLGSNFWAVTIYEKFGRNIPFYTAVLAGTCVTIGYGILQSFWYLLILRLIWGFSYSILRLRALIDIFSFKTEDEVQGRLSGIYRSITRVGYMSGMLFGGVFADFLGFSGAAYIIGFVSLAGVIILLFLYILKFSKTHIINNINYDKLGKSTSYLSLFTNKSYFIILLVGLIVHFTARGLINSSYGLYLQSSFGSEITLPIAGFVIGVATLNGFILSSNSLIELIFSPFLGWFIDKFKHKNLIFYSLLLQAVFLIILVLFNNIFVVIIAPILIFLITAFLIILLYIRADSLKHQTTSRRMAGLTTFGDLGAALGPLTLFFIDKNISLTMIYFFCAIIIICIGIYQQQNFKIGKTI